MRPSAWAATKPANSADEDAIDAAPTTRTHHGRAQRGDAVRAVARILQDLEPALTGGPAAERVGDVGQPVLVEGAGDQQPDGHRNRRRHRSRHELGQTGRDPADERADQRADDGKPRQHAVVGDCGAGANRNARQELDSAEEPAHSVPARTTP